MITWYRKDDNLGNGVITRFMKRRNQEEWDRRRCAELVRRFGEAAQSLGLAKDTTSNVGIPGLVAPQVTHIVFNGVVERLTIRMLPGQLIEQYRSLTRELAEALGVAGISFHRRTHGVVILELLRHDPLESIVDLPALTSGDADEVLVGMLGNGQHLKVDLGSLAHILVQGQTRSGKSRWVYGWLSQLAKATNVRISGSDVTGILLRPLQGTKHDQHLALGTKNLEHHAEVLESLVRIMDERIERVPEDRDTLPITDDDPYELVTIEELPGLIEAAENLDAQRKGQKLAARIRGAYGRLLAEGAKVGFRVLIIMQRADASIIGGFQRGQATVRLSFPVADPGSVKMLHSQVDDATADEHTLGQPGRALVSGPGIPVQRLRAPHMGDYAAFRDNVQPSLKSVPTEIAA